MKKAMFWMLLIAGIVAAVVLIRKRRSDLELEEWDSLSVGPIEKASEAAAEVKGAVEKTTK
jgi:hypothetical protein